MDVNVILGSRYRLEIKILVGYMRYRALNRNTDSHNVLKNC